MNKNISETTNSDINISGKYAAGRDITVNKYTNLKWLIFSLFVITIVTLGLIYRGQIITYVDSFKKFDKEDSKNLKILLLPFEAIQDNLNIKVDYRSELIESLATHIEKDSLAIRLLSLDGIPSPKTDKEAEEIAAAKNADLIIWGSYIENNDGPKIVRLRYNLLKDFEIPYINMKKSDKEGDISIDNISKLRSGFLQNDLFYLLNWIEGISSFNQMNFKKALNHFSVLQNDSLLLKQYDTFALNNLANVFLILGREQFTFPIFEILNKRMVSNPDKFNDLDKSEFFSLMGVAYDYSGENEKSIKHHKKAVSFFYDLNETGKEIETTKSRVFSNLGLKYSRMTMFDEAEKCFKTCQAADSILISNYELSSNVLWVIANNKINYSDLKLSRGEYKKSIKNSSPPRTSC